MIPGLYPDGVVPSEAQKIAEADGKAWGTSKIMDASDAERLTMKAYDPTLSIGPFESPAMEIRPCGCTLFQCWAVLCPTHAPLVHELVKS